ncbi:MAG: AtpZ/AtpI family protein [Candidatus Obscuribacter sp.]|jgi:F0F1-type ATP synthase assembly protein I|nr:AtpZ/AtpI family protein [Candidatus Obscuribacter sp.]MDQ5967044.1 AtpZ/AtpI family protein [Cyanobacteriota bacterium erpe_2018_sw_39hr_WHONDRS-SW48-000098_B_bin.30]MBK7836267.1 AtpZ/AtpI family protein [Candidatus Obscuribacter sp.]MBK9205957.1 AtpZ/AtpI family protein [Candidatus Obscuribacter sp.]MBK9617886.1 AtpZ/AtpI family protein [Candidatus Obscuribacter sp.]
MKNKTEVEAASLGSQIMMATELGSYITVLTLAGYFGGSYLDGQFKSGPYGVLVGIIAGFALGLVLVVKKSNELDSKSKQVKSALSSENTSQSASKDSDSI